MSFANDVVDLLGLFSFSMGALTLASFGYKMGMKSAPPAAIKAVKEAASKVGIK